MTRALAVITYGSNRKNWLVGSIDECLTDMAGAIGATSCDFIDLRKVLDNPADDISVKRGCDATDSATVLKVYSQIEFADTIITKLQLVMDKADLLVMVACCNSGFHRADTYGRTLMSCLNAITDTNGRLFNVMHFPLIRARSPRDIGGQIKAAMDWVEGPWREQETVTEDMRFAMSAVKQRKAAWQTFDDIWKYVDETNAWLNQPPREFEQDQEEAPEEVIEVEPELEEAERSPSPKRFKAALEPQTIKPTPKPGFRKEAASQPGKIKPVPKPPASPPAWRVPPPPPPAQKSSSTGAAASSQGEHEPWVHEPWQTQDLSSLPRVHEPWQTLDFNIENWVDTLEEADVDGTSMKELFLLAQLSDEGAYEANRIISKILKKKADGVALRNASAFVHTAVQGARNAMQSQA